MEPKLFESSPVPMFIYKQSILKANQAFINLVGFDDKELQSKDVWELFDKSYEIEIKEAVLNRLQNNYADKQYEMKLVTKHKKIVWVHAVNTTILYEGEHVGFATLFDITESKQINEQLHYRNELWTDIFNKNSAVLLLIDREDSGKIIDANPAAADFYGYSIQQLTSMSIYEINMLSSDEIQNQMGKAETRKQNEFFFKHQLANGDIRDVQVFSSVIHTNKKKLLFSIVTDITAQITFENKLVDLNAKLEESEQRYRSLFDYNPDICFVLNSNGIFQQLNHAIESVTGYTCEELQYMPINCIIEQSDQEISDYYFGKVLDGIAEQFDIRFLHKNGHILEITLMAVPIIIKNQVTGIIAIAKDITEQKQIELKLVEREKRYRFITENTTDIITRVTPEGIINYISPIVKEILQYEGCELISKSIIPLIHRHDLPNVMKSINEMRKKDYNEATIVSIQVKKKNGSFIFLETSIKPIKDENNQLEGYIMMSRDITERKQAEDHLTRVNQFLKELSSIDGLTGIYNRRYFDECLYGECTFGPQYSLPLSLIMFDIDYFKPYNDTYGHLKGDECLKLIADNVKEILKRSSDVFARYGGEEFAVILPSTDIHGAEMIAEKIRSTIESLRIPHETSKICDYVTVSVGISTIIAGSCTPDELLKQADTALYKAKNHGRNRIEIYEYTAIK